MTSTRTDAWLRLSTVDSVREAQQQLLDSVIFVVTEELDEPAMLLRSQAKQTLAASNTLRVLSHAIVMSVVCPGALGNTECGGLLALRTRWL